MADDTINCYVGHRHEHGAWVRWHDHNGIGEYILLRLDLVNHSPTGFEWGYGGSGPAQLAVAMLAHHFRTWHDGEMDPSQALTGGGFHAADVFRRLEELGI